MRKRIYLDNCCYNRRFDDQSQKRVHDEWEAIRAITCSPENRPYDIIGSDALRYEILNTRDPELREDLLTYYRNSVIIELPLTDDVIVRAEQLRAQTTLKVLDSLHIAFAEAGDAIALLTTDERMIRACKALELGVVVTNPVDYWKEVNHNDPE